eukprot:5490614-Amphidinium_carterae.1
MSALVPMAARHSVIIALHTVGLSYAQNALMTMSSLSWATRHHARRWSKRHRTSSMPYMSGECCARHTRKMRSQTLVGSRTTLDYGDIDTSMHNRVVFRNASVQQAVQTLKPTWKLRNGAYPQNSDTTRTKSKTNFCSDSAFALTCTVRTFTAKCATLLYHIEFNMCCSWSVWFRKPIRHCSGS